MSGKNPSPIKEISKKSELRENIDIGLSDSLSSFCLKKLKNRIPIVAKIPMKILSLVNFKFLSFTLEQNTPTMITESKLQDFAITTAGNDAYITASLYVRPHKLITKLHCKHFFHGMWTDSFWNKIHIFPTIIAKSCGNIVKTKAESNIFYARV